MAIVVFVVIGVIPAPLLLHLGLSAVAGASNSFKRARVCNECCFLDESAGSCTNRLWGWLFVSRLCRRHGLVAALCPFCYNRLSTDPVRAESTVIRAYLKTTGRFLLVSVPAFLGALWAVLKLKGG